MKLRLLSFVVLVNLVFGFALAEEPENPADAAGMAERALSAGRVSKGKGRLGDAQAHFQEAVAQSQPGSATYEIAEEELEYHLPLMWVQRYVFTGNWAAAEHQLSKLIERYQEDEEKREHLLELMTRVRSNQSGQSREVYVDPGEGRVALENVKKTLNRYFLQHQRYPRNYAELNELLPPDRYPLKTFDIVDYVSRGEAYGLTLRSKANPENVLVLQITGPVQ